MFKPNECHFFWPCIALLALVKLKAITCGSSGHGLSVTLMILGQNFYFHPRYLSLCYFQPSNSLSTTGALELT